MMGLEIVESVVRPAVSWLSLLAEIVAIGIVALAVVRGAWRSATAFTSIREPHLWTSVRLDLGRSLAVALEFLLAADVVRTAVAPTWDDIGRLAAIAVIRTGLNYFLQREIEAMQTQNSGSRP